MIRLISMLIINSCIEWNRKYNEGIGFFFEKDPRI
jgi:hypothetical protein